MGAKQLVLQLPPNKGESPEGIRAVNVSGGYAGMAVLRDIDLIVEPGEIVGVFGANGAGKTTLLRVLAGEIPLMGGTLEWNMQPFPRGLRRRVRQGLRYLPEERSVFGALSVSDNLRLGGRIADRALEQFPELRPLMRRRAGLLSGGEQQILSVARALAPRPAVLLVDELSMGLAPKVVRRLHQALREAADEGMAVVMVEQHVREALEVADRVMVLRRGIRALEGPADQFRNDIDALRSAYL